MKKLDIYIAKFQEPCRFHSLVDEVERDEMHPLIQYANNNRWILRFKMSFKLEAPPAFRMFVAKKELQDFEAHEFGFSDGFFLSTKALLLLNRMFVAKNNVYDIVYRLKGEVRTDYNYLMFTEHFRDQINYSLSKFCMLRKEVKRNDLSIVEKYYQVINRGIIVKDYYDLLLTERRLRNEYFNAEFSPEILVFKSGVIEELDLFSPFIIDNAVYASGRFKSEYANLNLTGFVFKEPFGEFYTE